MRVKNLSIYSFISSVIDSVTPFAYMNVTIITASPIIILSGIPNWNTFICGIVRDNTPNTTSATNMVAIIGAAIFNAISNSRQIPSCLLELFQNF